ncbi:MAG: GNAT family N-acetyltransferase [Chloroflexi bacterium]|nr:GNAT family N-acetyltransferase [Chloroflexota bacterium]
MARIRPATLEDAAGIARVHVDSWRSTYAGIVPDDYLAGLRYERSEAVWRRNLSDPQSRSVYLVAEDESGSIVGFVCGGPGRDEHPDYSGELYAIYLFQEVQGQGIGRRLMKTLADEMLARRYASWLIWVLKDNPARGFYERMGGVYVMEKDIEIGGANLREVAYGWRDLTCFRY